MNYPQAIKRLLSINLFGGMKLSLENALRLDTVLKHPSKAFPSIHIAGTNGKGSVTKKIATALQLAGYRVGLYTSPHISCFRERIRVNGEMIPESSVASILKQVFDVVEQENIDATFFEIATLLAFRHFANEKVDFAVIETGLGGRFDATNIVASCLSVITSISLDHTEVLGNTVEEIAFEKAGIIKPKVPVILGPRLPHHIFETTAQALLSTCISVSGHFSNFEEENCAVANAALKEMKIDDRAIHEGLKARLPCRLEKIIQQGSQPIILDVAHNPDGLQQLIKSIKHQYPSIPLRFLCGFSKNKDVTACLKILQKNAGSIHFIEAPNGRGLPAMEMKAKLLELGMPDPNIFVLPSTKENLEAARLSAKKKGEILVVCGTFFIMSDIRAALGISEPKDIIDMNERNINIH